jgi:hypothetical protein
MNFFILLFQFVVCIIMKKWFKALAIVGVLALISIYVFIPHNIIVSKTVFINCTLTGAYRFLSDENKIEKWWPSKGSNKEIDNFTYKNRSYRLGQKLYNSVEIAVQDDKAKFAAKVNIFALPNGLIAAEWVCRIDSSFNPIKKIINYREGKNMQNDFADILQSLKLFLEKKENVYGFLVQQTSTTDTVLISAKWISSTKPSTAEIYNRIETIKKYILRESRTQTGYPLLNITRLDSGTYQTMIALPINKPLKGNNEFIPKRMVPGNFLLSEIKGGDRSIDEAFTQMNLYLDDYRKVLVAIPFQVMVTDRSAETDTSKWITKIYYPIY